MIPPAASGWIRMIYPYRIWSLPVAEKVLYLSFDDGPHPIITQKVLKLLNQYQAKATFFCIGDKVERHFNTFESIKTEGHSIGNHSYHHLNGWKTKDQTYLEDVQKADALIQSKLFRPPYGRLKATQASKLRQMGFSLIMWSVLSADYDKRMTKEKCAARVLRNIKPGAIILFHDSENAADNMLFALNELLKEATANGYRFDAINNR